MKLLKIMLLSVTMLQLTACSGIADKIAARADIREKTYEEAFREAPENSEADKLIPIPGIGDTDSRQKAIADSVSAVDGVSTACAVITGNTAIVGVTLDAEIDDGRFIEFKRELEAVVRGVDSRIAHVSVTNAPDLVRRIYKMQNVSGMPISDNRI